MTDTQVQEGNKEMYEALMKGAEEIAKRFPHISKIEVQNIFAHGANWMAQEMKKELINQTKSK